MCRKNHLRGALALGFGFGLLLGYSLDSWLICTFGGLGLLILGLCLLCKR